MNVLMIAPGYPGEMPYFCRGLTQHGGKVYGLSDVPENDLPALARQHLSGYLRVPNLTDEGAVVRHPDLSACYEISDAVGTDLQLYAG